MNIFIALIIFLISILIHEITHLLIAWYFNKKIPRIHIAPVYISIMPVYNITINQKRMFLGYPILTGLLTIVLFIFFYPNESVFASFIYLISCGADFYKLVLLEVRK